MRPIRHLILPAIVAALLLPASAGAATLAPLKPCYVSVDAKTLEPVDVDAAGFPVGSHVDVAIDGVIVQSGLTVLLDGRITGSVSAPFQASGQRPFTLSATEQENPANTVSATSKVTALSLKVRPKQARPGRRVRFSGRGFTSPGLPVFGHYVFGGKLRKTVKLGVPHGDCGVFSVKRRQIPIHKPRTGRWTLQADTQRAYSKTPTSVFVRLAITVKRVFRPN